MPISVFLKCDAGIALEYTKSKNNLICRTCEFFILFYFKFPYNVMFNLDIIGLAMFCNRQCRDKRFIHSRILQNEYEKKTRGTYISIYRNPSFD